MQPILSMSMWVALGSDERARIRAIFEIPKSKFAHVDDGKIISDGTTPDDFKALTVEKMQAYLDSDSTDFHKLFDLVVAKVREELHPAPKPELVPEVKPVATIVGAEQMGLSGKPKSSKSKTK